MTRTIRFQVAILAVCTLILGYWFGLNATPSDNEYVPAVCLQALDRAGVAFDAIATGINAGARFDVAGIQGATAQANHAVESYIEARDDCRLYDPEEYK